MPSPVPTPTRPAEPVHRTGAARRAAPLPPLLTATEEHELSLTIEAGVLAQEVLAGDRSLPTATGDELQQLVAEGEQARIRFTEANIGLAKMVARQFAVRSGVSEADVFQEACLGLLLAVRRYDCRRGFRFATYALFWIRAHAGDAAARALGDLNLPTSRATQLRALRGVETELTQTLGRSATARDVAAAVERSEDWVAEVLAHRAPRSLSQLEPDLVDTVAHGVSTRQPGAVAGHDELGGAGGTDAAALLRQLSGTARQVLELRLGFTTGEPLGYAAVGRRLQLPVGRVRRLEQTALERLRDICPYDAVDR